MNQLNATLNAASSTPATKVAQISEEVANAVYDLDSAVYLTRRAQLVEHPDHAKYEELYATYIEQAQRAVVALLRDLQAIGVEVANLELTPAERVLIYKMAVGPDKE